MVMDSIRALLILMFFLILGCLLTALHGHEVHNSMQVLDEIKIQEKFVRLKHLIPVLEDQKEGDLLICRRPVKDKPVILSKEYLKKLLIAKGAEKVLELVKLPESITIHYDVMIQERVALAQASQSQTNKTEIDPNEVLILITEEVEKMLSELDADVTIYLRNRNTTWLLDVPEDYELKILPGISVRSNMVTARVAVYHNEKIVDRKAFNFEADIFVQGLVSSRDIETGSVVKQGDFAWQKIAYSADINNAVRSESDILGKVLKKRLRAGSAVEEKDLEMPNLMTRGEMVSVLVKGQGFEIKTSGIAQDKAKIGDVVEVILKGSKKKVLCIARGANEVEVFN